MLDNESESPLDGQVVSEEQSSQPDTTMAMVIYALYLASFILGFTSIIGVVIAYVYKAKALRGWTSTTATRSAPSG